MESALAEVIPLGLAVAASPFAIIPAILLLLAPRAVAAGSAYLAGWLLGLAAGATAFALLSGVLPESDETPAWAAWGRIVLGVLLLALAVRSWLGRRTPKPAPAWMESLSSATPRRAFRLALVMALANPKILLLSAAAGLTVGSAHEGLAASALAIAIYALVAAITVIIPFAVYLIRRERIVRRLEATRDWLARHNAVVMAVVFAVLGVVLVLEGVAYLPR